MRSDFLFPGRAGGDSESEQGTGREGHVFVPCQKHASPPFLGWNAHSKQQELREGGGRTSGSTGLEQKEATPHSRLLLSSWLRCISYACFINARERRERDSCLSQTCDVDKANPRMRGWGMSLGAIAFLRDLGVPRMSSRSAEKSPDPVPSCASRSLPYRWPQLRRTLAAEMPWPLWGSQAEAAAAEGAAMAGAETEAWPWTKGLRGLLAGPWRRETLSKHRPCP